MSRRWQIESTLFSFAGGPTSPESAEERSKIVRRFAAVLDEFGGEASGLWEYLCAARRGYDPDSDGPSELMSLVDDIRSLNNGEYFMRACVSGLEGLRALASVTISVPEYIELQQRAEEW